MQKKEKSIHAVIDHSSEGVATSFVEKGLNLSSENLFPNPNL